MRIERVDPPAVADELTMLRSFLDYGLDRLAVRDRRGKRVSLRWIMVHMVEEYARRCGHADLIRESVDGATEL